MSAPTITPEAAPEHAARQPFLHDLAGAANGAATSFAVSVGGGALIFAPLGPEWLPYGIVAAFIATVGGGAVASILSSTPVALSSPRAASCIVLAGFVATLSRALPGLPAQGVIALASLTVVTAGLIQMLASAMRLGRLIRFVPFPVVSGFTHGIALSLLLAFTPLLLGVAELPRIAWPRPDAWHWGAPLVGTVALAAIVLASRLNARLPAIFIGMAVGVAFYLAMAALVPGLDAGAVVSPARIPQVQSPFLYWEAVPHVLRDPLGPRLMLSFAVALACVASIDSMVGTMVVETQHHVRSRPDRDLLAQGIGNAIAGAFGGAAISYSVVSVQAARSAGGQGRMVGPMASAGVALLAVACALLLDSVPLAVLAAIMIFVAFRLADPWGTALVRAVARHRGRLDATTRESFAVYLLVALSIIVLDFVAALAVGLIASSVIFIRTMNQHVVRGIVVGAGIRSRRLYPPSVMPVLSEAMKSVAVVELEGPLFFGTADRIFASVERLPRSVRYVVVDLRRVQALDATAGAVLARTRVRLASERRTLLLCGGPEGIAGVDGPLPPAFPDRDRAVEWIEGRILEEAGLHAADTSIDPDAIGQLLGLDAEETRRLLGVTEIRELPAGEAVFREGDAGSELYFLLHGRLSIYLTRDGTRGTRVVTFLPGNTFGDVAFIDGRPRTASAVCDVDCRLLLLSRAGLDRLALEAPEVVAHIYASLALDIAGRLRNTDMLLREELSP
jgi:SulP family sulfate permease